MCCFACESAPAFCFRDTLKCGMFVVLCPARLDDDISNGGLFVMWDVPCSKSILDDDIFVEGCICHLCGTCRVVKAVKNID